MSPAETALLDRMDALLAEVEATCDHNVLRPAFIRNKKVLACSCRLEIVEMGH